MQELNECELRVCVLLMLVYTERNLKINSENCQVSSVRIGCSQVGDYTKMVLFG